MSILVVSENSNKELKSTTLNCITAAKKISEEIHVVVIGNQCEEVVKQAAIVENVKKVLHLDDPLYENPVAENIASVVVNLSKRLYSYYNSQPQLLGKILCPELLHY